MENNFFILFLFGACSRYACGNGVVDDNDNSGDGVCIYFTFNFVVINAKKCNEIVSRSYVALCLFLLQMRLDT